MAPTKIVSPSELDTYRQCPLKHELSYKERWAKPTTSPALIRGTNWHAVMEAHYLSLKDTWGGPSGADVRLLAARTAVNRILDRLVADGLDIEDLMLLRWMYDGHVELYQDDPDWEIVAVEYRNVVWLPTSTGNRSSFQIKMKLDLIVRDHRLGGTWIVDHKSGKNLPKKKELDLDDQFGLYEWGIRQLGKKILGTIHNAARTHRNVDQTKHPQPLDERFSRTRMSRTDLELDTIAAEAYRTMRQAYRIPVGEAPRSPNPDICKWKCDFLEPCLMIRKGADRLETIQAYGFRQDFTRH